MVRWLSLIAVLTFGIQSCQSIPQPTIAAHGLPKEITGKDGAPMMLVPAGEFIMGVNEHELVHEERVHRVYLDAFYMDKYEVTVSRYTSFLKTAGHKQPDYWDQRTQVSAENLPVIGIDWNDADAYCRQYGKRLPSEQEWEKAARGTDGRMYPWGNEEPSSRYANYVGKHREGADNWYSGLKQVGSYEAGKSSYGIYDLAGNVWEWTNSDDAYNISVNNTVLKVVRGGFWNDAPINLRSATRNVVEPTSRAAVGGFRCVQSP